MQKIKNLTKFTAYIFNNYMQYMKQKIALRESIVPRKECRIVKKEVCERKINLKNQEQTNIIKHKQAKLIKNT